MFTRRYLMALAASVALATPAIAQEKSIVVASTTSTQDSGLFSHILPAFQGCTCSPPRSPTNSGSPTPGSSPGLGCARIASNAEGR